MSTEGIIRRIRNLSPAKLHRIETVLTAIERDPSDESSLKASSWLADVDRLSEHLARTYGSMPDSVATLRELRDTGPR